MADVMEQAMADALASVERIEREKNGEADDAPTVEVPIPQATQTAPPADDAAERAAKDAETIKTLNAELAAAKDQLLRLAADFDNFRKRARRERDETQQYGNERFAKELLPVLDNLERALGHAAQPEDPVIQGVRMVMKMFTDTLGGFGIKSFVAVGTAFDPERHEAMGQVPSAEASPGTVLHELEKGYLLRDRLLRPAKVMIAAAPPTETSVAAPPAETADDDAGA